MPNLEKLTFASNSKFIFKKDIDIVSFLALFLSLSISLTSLGWHFYKKSKGAQIELFPTDFIILLAEQINEGDPVMRIGARLSYINNADPGYNAAIKSEYIEVTIDGITYRQESLERVFFNTIKKPNGCPTSPAKDNKKEKNRSFLWGKIVNHDGKKIYNCGSSDFYYKVSVNSINPIKMLLKGGSGISSETFFYPVKFFYYPKNAKKNLSNRTLSHQLKWDKLINALNPVNNKNIYLTFKIGIETWKGDNHFKECKIKIVENDIHLMRDAGYVIFDQRCNL